MSFVPVSPIARGRARTSAELKGVLPNGHEKSVAATLLRSVRGLGPEGQDFLRMAASLAAGTDPAVAGGNDFCRSGWNGRVQRAPPCPHGSIAS